MKKEKIKTFLRALALIAAGIILTVDSAGTVEALKSAVTVCLCVIIPSLFSFMVFSTVLVRSGIGGKIFTPLYFLCRPWFKRDKKMFTIFMLSLIGGYPVGVKLLREEIAQNKSYSEIASSMLIYCYCGSPTFIVAVVGLELYGSVNAGLVVYLSNLLAAITLAFGVNLFSKRRGNQPEKPASKDQSSGSSLTDSLIFGISSSVSALAIICGTILAFAVILEIFEYCGLFSLLPESAAGIIRALTEISNISRLGYGDYSKLPVIAGICSTGGVCILMQTASIAGGLINLKKFFLARIPAAILSGIYCMVLKGVLLQDITVSTSRPYVFAYSAASPICSICLIFMTYILLKYAKKDGKISRY